VRLSSAEQLLRDLGWINDDRSVVSVEVAGVGNMNRVERVVLDDGCSLILKRASPWVEKYPEIPAPVERSGVEADFYAFVAGTAAARAMPRLIAHERGSAAMLLADLGAGADGMGAYAGAPIAPEHVDAVADWLRALHALPVPADHPFANRAMRALNAEHIFDFPLAPDSDFDCDAILPGLKAHADRLKTDTAFVAAVQAVKAAYLGDAPGVLLHGDMYPGSWLATPDTLFVIDPEFCWVGPREWDLGVLIAHLKLSRQPDAARERLLARYAEPLNPALLDRITGTEIMRRLIGVAQLPLPYGLEERATLLEEARALVLCK
jgi:5-methylthioribose kinase